MNAKVLSTHTVRLCAGIFLLISLLSVNLTAAVRYVRQGGTGNGATWGNASGDLQAMINASGAGDQIWVAQGTYNNGSFVMKNGVEILGGFPNTGNPGLGARNWIAHVTTLSGGSNIILNAFTIGSPLTGTAVLDGFTITGGSGSANGGGMFNNYASPTVRNCVFSGNSALQGAGMYNMFATPTVTNCIFSGNICQGPGLQYGAGMANEFSSPTVTNCLFSNNVAGTSGSGMHNGENSNPLVLNCTFSGNTSNIGSAIYNRYANSNPTIKNCIVWGNDGGITNNGASSTVTYSIVQGGYAGTGNLNVDPLFVFQPPIGLGTTGDLQLQACSPAIDAGTSMGAPTTDILGNARVDAIAGGNSVDMGAYEYQSTLQTEIEITSVTSTPIICQNDGSITAVASATCQLVGTITYSINGVGGNTANTTGVFNGLPNGNYTVTVYDNGNPTNLDETTVTVGISITAPVVTAAATAALCNGGNGQITLTVANGTAPYDYVWNGPGANDGSVINVASHIITPAPPGTYAITATDANGCETTTSSIVTEPATNVQGNGMDIADGDATPSLSDHTDFGTTSIGVGFARTFTILNTGSAPFAISSITSNNNRFAVSGAPASVAANSSATFTVTFTPTAAGAQNATITVNNNNCVYDFAITGNGACPAITINAPTITQPTCVTPTGTIVVNATGSGALEYSINNGSTWQSTNTYGGQAPGNYNIKVRLQANPSCETTYGSNPVVLTSPFTASTTADTWTGCVSTNWATPGNWADGSVPTAADDVTIPNVTNDPVIMGGTAAVAKSVLVQASAVFTIQATGSLDINGSTGFSLENFGTLDNSGTIRIGNVSSVANRGIVHRNGGTLNNKPGGLIQIDRTSVGEAFYTSGIVNNDGTVTIGSLAAVEDIGLSLESTGVFNNNASATLNIDRSDLVGIANFGLVNNYGALNIGLNANVGQDGIQNQGNFVNAATGVITGSKFNSNGIWNYIGSFQNSGKITLANTVGNGNGNGILSYVPFTNNAGAEIHLDHMLSGIVTTSTFNNAGLIRVGETGALTGYGINNTGGVAAVFNNNAGGDIRIKQTDLDAVQNSTNATFNNNACATLTVFDNLNNAGTFTNAGFMTVNTAQAHTNSALTNNGIIAYPQGNPIPNVTNNEIVIAPTTANACDVISPALGLGSPVDFTIMGIFTDEAATMTAGTYTTATNTFTPTTILPEGIRTFYVKITDGIGGCMRIVPWQLTTQNCCPTVTAPTVTQPTCAIPTGTIVVNATGSGALEYSINNGSTWQTSNTYGGQAPGSYNIKVRLQANPACEVAYTSNPVVLTSPFTASTTTDTWTGCVSTDWATPGNWADGSVPTATNDVIIPNVTNDPVIMSSIAALAKSVTVQSGAVLTIAVTGLLTIDGSATQGILNQGTVENSGILNIGQTTSTGQYGINSSGTFHNNTGGQINIDRSTGTGFFSSGPLNNYGTVTIGANATVGQYGLRASGTFNNHTGGQITADRASTFFFQPLFGTFTNDGTINIGTVASGVFAGFENGATFNNNTSGQINIGRGGSAALRNSATFNNVGNITIGTILSGSGQGLYNTGTFNNNTGGQITIDGCTNVGLNQPQNTAIFNNYATINIGATSSVGSDGIQMGNNAVFNNHAGGQITIDRSTSAGLNVSSSSAFHNFGRITIGATASVGNFGVSNSSIFNNNACATLTSFAPISNASTRTITNSGLFTVNTANASTNAGTFTNNGILEYPQGNPIPNVTNNEIVIAPTTANACDVISPAFGLGSPVDFTIQGIFTNEAATVSAGTYVTATNTFTPTSVLAEGVRTYYVKITDGSGGCTRIIPWQLTTEDCCPATGAIWYVNAAAAPGGNGASWDCAFQDLQLALAAASSGHQIWVAEGTYKPTSGTNRSISFNMKNGVEILGGFPNTGDPGLGDRDWAANVTTLSGEIGAAGMADNSNNIIANNDVNSTAVLDGFQVSFGSGLSGGDTFGGGLFNFFNASPTVRNCTFSSNHAVYGGGVYNFQNCFPTFTNCAFIGNQSSIFGVACHSYGNSVATLINCSFSGNTGGNGIIYGDSPPVLKNCIIWGNGTQAIAGTATITNSIIEGGYTGVGNLDFDPLFISQPPVGLGTAGDLRLQICSPAIDAGNDSDAPANDLDGNPRVNALPGGSIADMGAFEFQTAATPTVAICQSSVNAVLDNTGQATVLATALNNGSVGCSPLVFSINGQSSASFNCSQTGSQTVTLTATYINRTATCTTTVNVIDNIAPSITCPDAQTLVLGANCTATLPNYTSLATTGDNCGVQGVAQSPVAGTTVSGAGNMTVTLTVTDINGNPAQCSFTVTKVDQTPPTITCPTTQTLALGANCTATLLNYTSLATTGDNCGVQSVTQSPVAGTTVSSAGNMTVTLTVTDINGLTNSCTFTVTKVDNTAPSITCPATQTLTLGANCTATLPNYTSLATTGDNCGVQSVTQSPVAGTTVSGAGNLTVTLTVTDINGNPSECSFTVTKVDQTPPTITCPATQTLVLGANCTATLPNYTSLATTGDNCGVQSVTQSPVAGTTVSGAGNMTVTLTVTDINGLTNSCTFTVTKVDNTAPSITCPATQTLALGANCTASLANYTSLATTGDNCGVQSVTQSPVAGTTVSGAGNMTVTLTVTDVNGLTNTCTFTVTKVDNTAPAITCPATQTLALGANCTATLPNYTSLATTGDNCGVQSVTQSPVVGTTVSGAGNTTVTLTVTDVNGLTNSCTFTVTKVDNTAPSITCLTTKTLVLDANCTATLPNYTSFAMTSDNCGVQGVTQSPAAGTTVSNAGNMTVTLTVTDVNGLTNSCQFTVTKMDETPPTVVCKNTTVFLNAAGNYTLLASDVFNAAASSDNCSGELAVTNISPATVSCNQANQTIPVTVTVQDAAGNSATCTAQITVQEGLTLPGGWSSNNVGNANGSGGYKPCTTANGQFTVSATGFSTSSADVLHLTSRLLCGDGEIIARVANVTGGGWAGITLRETLAPGSKKVALKTQLTSNIRREIRTVTNGAVNNLNYFRPQHTWLRLVRNGSNFVGYTSTDGTNWSFAFSATMSMTGCIYAGLFAESINTNVTTTATFDNVQVLGGTSSLVEAPQTPVSAPTFSPEVYPNPTDGEVNIDLSVYANPIGTVKVFDAYGKLVMRQQLDGSPLFHMKLDGEDGVYFLSIEVEGMAPVTKRVVIAH